MPEFNVDAALSANMTNERLAEDLERIAGDVKFFPPAVRSERLREASRRLTARPARDMSHIVSVITNLQSKAQKLADERRHDPEGPVHTAVVLAYQRVLDLLTPAPPTPEVAEEIKRVLDEIDAADANPKERALVVGTTLWFKAGDDEVRAKDLSPDELTDRLDGLLVEDPSGRTVAGVVQDLSIEQAYGSAPVVVVVYTDGSLSYYVFDTNS